MAELVKAGFVVRESRPGKSTTYKLSEPGSERSATFSTRPKIWASPKNGPAQKADHHPVQKLGQGVAQNLGHEGNPYKEIQEGTPSFPVFAKPEGKVSGSKKSADSRHHEITSRIGERHKSATGQPMVITGRDVTALKSFLSSWKGTAEEFLTTAEKAWTRSRQDRFARNCLNGSSLHGLCTSWQAIQAELARASQPGTATAGSMLRPKFDIRRGMI